jgi:hypothetical protein
VVRKGQGARRRAAEKVEVKRMESEKILTEIKMRVACFLSHSAAFTVPIENRFDIDPSLFMAADAHITQTLLK